MTYQVDVLNPKAIKLLQDLADLDLISITQNSEDSFLKVVTGLREKASSNPPSFDEITKEVEFVRAKLHKSENNGFADDTKELILKQSKSLLNGEI